MCACCREGVIIIHHPPSHTSSHLEPENTNSHYSQKLIPQAKLVLCELSDCVSFSDTPISHLISSPMVLGVVLQPVTLIQPCSSRCSSGLSFWPNDTFHFLPNTGLMRIMKSCGARNLAQEALSTSRAIDPCLQVC